MIIIDRIILFNENTSKVDLIGNKNPIATLNTHALDGKIKYNMDSGHMCYITLDVDLLGDLVNSIPKNGVIKTYAQNEYDYWVIVNIDENLDVVELTCRHWGTEATRSMFIMDSKPRNLNGLNMLDWLKTNSEEYKQGKQFARDLEVGSNLSDLKSTNIWHDNFYNAISDLQELYGCEIKKSEFKVSLVDYVGSKIPKYKIEYGKNLISNESETETSIIKGVLAKGYDKLYANNIVYSGKLINTPNMLGETVEKEYPVRVREEGKEDEEGYTYFNNEAEAKVELERLASLEFTVNKVDEPKVTFDTEFLELSTVEEHKDDAKVWLSIGDKIATYIPKFNIDIETRIIEMEVDILADEITTITLSNNDIKDLKPPTLNSIKKEIQKLPTAEDVLLTAKKESINTVMNGFGGYSHYAKNFTAWTDETDIKQARKGIVANKYGIMFFRNGINIETGEANDVTLIMDINGNFNCSVLNSGEINASLIKAGILKSFNGKSWLNMEDGTFDFANGSLSFDGLNLQMIGKIINVVNGYGVELDKGGVSFATNGEVVGGIRSSRFTSDTRVNGMSIVNTRDGDYIDIGFTGSENFEGDVNFTPKIRVSKSLLPLIGNFIGIQFFDNIIVRNNKFLYLDSNNLQYPHEIYNAIEGRLAIFGNDGIIEGYKNGNERVSVFEITETPISEGSQAIMHKQLSMQGNKINFVDEIYKYGTTGRYYHDGWCGSITKDVKRISNLNVVYDSGWYGFSDNANGAPCQYGVLLHLKWGVGSDLDSSQLAMELGTGRLFTRATYNNGAMWSAWSEK